MVYFTPFFRLLQEGTGVVPAKPQHFLQRMGKLYLNFQPVSDIISKVNAGVMELVDVTDSKSVGSDTVWVRVPPPAPRRSKLHIACSDFFTKSQSALIPLLLLFNPQTLCWFAGCGTGVSGWVHLFGVLSICCVYPPAGVSQCGGLPAKPARRRPGQPPSAASHG